MCFRYLHARSIASAEQEQRVSKVLFGVMFSLLCGRNRARLKSCLERVVGDEPFHAGKTTTDRLIVAPVHGLVRSLQCAAGLRACQRFSDCGLSLYPEPGKADR